MIAAMMAFIVAAASDQSGVTIDFAALTPFLTAVSGIVMGFLAARRSEKADKVQQEQTEVTSLIQGYTNQIAAYSEIVKSLQTEVSRLRTQFDVDRDEWERERTEMHKHRTVSEAKISSMEAELKAIKNG